MSSLLFLGSVGAFVLIAYWAYQNDAMQPHECGSGLLAMCMPMAASPKSIPKWMKTGKLEGPRKAARPQTASAVPLWRRTFLYGSAR